MTDEPKPRAKRGFQLLSPEERRAISSKAGKATPPEKRTFSRDRNLAKVAAEMRARMIKAAKDG